MKSELELIAHRQTNLKKVICIFGFFSKMYVYVLCKYIVHFLGNKHKKEALKLAQLTFHQRMFEFQFLKTGTFLNL